MSRSTRKPIIRDKPNTRLYHRAIRRVTKHNFKKSTQELMQYSPQWLFEAEDEITEFEIPNPKTIVNDYDYSDWKWDLSDREVTEYFDTNKFKRK